MCAHVMSTVGIMSAMTRCLPSIKEMWWISRVWHLARFSTRASSTKHVMISDDVERADG